MRYHLAGLGLALVLTFGAAGVTSAQSNATDAVNTTAKQTDVTAQPDAGEVGQPEGPSPGSTGDAATVDPPAEVNDTLEPGTVNTSSGRELETTTLTGSGPRRGTLDPIGNTDARILDRDNRGELDTTMDSDTGVETVTDTTEGDTDARRDSKFNINVAPGLIEEGSFSPIPTSAPQNPFNTSSPPTSRLNRRPDAGSYPGYDSTTSALDEYDPYYNTSPSDNVYRRYEDTTK